MFKNKVGRPSNEVLRKRRILKGILLSIVFILVFSITYTLTNISTKRLKGELDGPAYLNMSCSEETACYEAGFRNGNLYQRVIESYNSENGANLSYEDVITDSELASIRYLSARRANIDDATGIEKLTGLEDLDLSEKNNISEINLSGLTNLTYLSLYNNNLSSIDLSNLTNLEDLDLSNNFLSEIDLSNLTNLTYLSLDNNNLSSIDLSNLTNLEDLDLSNNFLSEIDLSGLTNLEDLDLSNNFLSEIDLSNNTKLERLDLSSNDLTEIDLSNLIDLGKLIIENNKLSTIDLSNNHNIYSLRLDPNLYSMVDFNNHSYLYSIGSLFLALPGEEIDLSDALSNIDQSSIGIGSGENVISYNNGIIRTLKEGYGQIRAYFSDSNYYKIQILVYDKIDSDNYDINYNDRYLYVGEDDDSKIISNLSIDNKFYINDYCGEPEDEDELNECLEEIEEEGAGFGFKIYNDVLKVIPMVDYDLYPFIYKLGRIDLSDYEVDGKEIYAPDFDVDDIKSYNVTLEYDDNTLTVKDLKGNVVDTYTVVSGNNNNPGNNIDDNNNDNNNNDNNNNDNNNNDNNNNDNNDTTTSKTTLNKFDDNAKTYDDIVKYLIIGGVSIILITSIIVYKSKKK